MLREPRDWSVPVPLRALLWWPLVSFVIGIAVPEAAEVAIIASGFVLAAVGVLAHAVDVRRRRRRPVHLPVRRPEPVEFDAAA